MVPCPTNCRGATTETIRIRRSGGGAWSAVRRRAGKPQARGDRRKPARSATAPCLISRTQDYRPAGLVVPGVGLEGKTGVRRGVPPNGGVPFGLGVRLDTRVGGGVSLGLGPLGVPLGGMIGVRRGPPPPGGVTFAGGVEDERGVAARGAARLGTSSRPAASAIKQSQ